MNPFKNLNPFLIFAILVLAISAFWYYWGIYGAHMIYLEADGALQDAGLFGDSFGALNALFTGLALAALVCTILIQQAELRDTRDIFKLQRFENSFFQMLELHNQIIAFFKFNPKNPDIYLIHGRPLPVYVEREMFTGLFEEFINHYYPIQLQNLGQLSQLERINAAYRNLYADYEIQVSHYFRNLYTIVKYVNDSDVSNKKHYIRILRAQLSGREMYMIALNCLSDLGAEKFKPLVVKYNLLNNFPSDLSYSDDIKQYYDQRAFE